MRVSQRQGCLIITLVPCPIRCFLQDSWALYLISKWQMAVALIRWVKHNPVTACKHRSGIQYRFETFLHPSLLIVLYTCKTSGTNLKSCDEKISLFYFIYLFIFFFLISIYVYVYFFFTGRFFNRSMKEIFCCYSDCGYSKSNEIEPLSDVRQYWSTRAVINVYAGHLGGWIDRCCYR